MESLLLIPDISGFTRFVNETESEHGRHIVAELLEIIIDSDELGLTVAEIEGDAVLFYLKDDVPPIDLLAAEAERMFVNFHAHLQMYESRRICRCGACTSAQSLGLKIIAHSGPIDFIHVKGFQKPFGPDVILAHRLLKNDIPDHEYLLITNALAGDSFAESSPNVPEWIKFQNSHARYDDVGIVHYRYATMGALYERIPAPPEVEDFERIPNPVTKSVYIDRPVADTYELVSNLGLRLSFSDGVDKLEYEKDRVNRTGTRHQCVVRGDLLEFETTTADFGPRKLVYGERLMNPPFLSELTSYTVLEAEGEGTRVRVEYHYQGKPFPGSLLVPLFRFGANRQLKQQLASMKDVAEAA